MLVLASASPRRRQLLRAWGVRFRTMPSQITEPPPERWGAWCGPLQPQPGRARPIPYARRLARAKAEAVARRLASRGKAAPGCSPAAHGPNTWVLGADTIVVTGWPGRARKPHILGKPRTKAEAERMLAQLSGTRHRVVTAVALIHAGTGTTRIAHAVSTVTMRRLTPAEIRRYARKHLDKAGAYAVQDADDPVVTAIKGSYTNVVGLPEEVVRPLLRAVGLWPDQHRPERS